MEYRGQHLQATILFGSAYFVDDPDTDILDNLQSDIQKNIFQG